MAVRLCPDAVPLNTQCPSANPFENLSSEAFDGLDYLTTMWEYGTPGGVPPFGQSWTATECGITYISHISQLDADLHAAAEAVNCAKNKTYPTNPPTGEWVLNEFVTSCAPCPPPSGGSFCSTVPAGLFEGINQAEANYFAYAQGRIWAFQTMFCFGPCPPPGEVGTPYSFQLTVSGGTPPYTIYIMDGTLPDGLSLSSDGLISGTPTTPVALSAVTFGASDSSFIS